jgi:hypothetical protein
MTSQLERSRKVVVCHVGHENDDCYTQNIFEFLSENGIDHGFVHLRGPHVTQELQACLKSEREISLLGFNSQIDHTWVDDQPLPVVAARHGVTVVQWFFDHPSARWPEFNYSDPSTSRFLFHSRYSQAYFTRYCCSGALTATVGSIGPNRRSRSEPQSLDAFSCRPVACLIALGLARLNRAAAETEAEIDSLAPSLVRSLRDAMARARFDLDQPLEVHLLAALDASGCVLDNSDFSRCFRLLNDSVQTFRRARIFRVARQFGVHIQSDETARVLIDGGRASFRVNVGTPETLDSMPLCRAVLSVCPVNDSIHDRTCNALNAGCLPILEDNRAHRDLFTHGENALLFRYEDDSLAECLAIACGNPEQSYPMAERATTMRDQPVFRFGAFQNIVALANLDPEPPSVGTPVSNNTSLAKKTPSSC